MKGFLNPDKLFAMTPWKQQGVSVFLLLDCADEHGRVIQALGKWPQHEVIPLFVGTKDEENADIGPHLVKVDRDSQLLQWFLEEGAEYGIILFSQASAEVLAGHLQPYLECLWPDDQRKMFRFYDPMTFYYFIPNLTPEELSLFMGPACGAACTRPVCADEGDSLFVEHPIALEHYTPPKRRRPWFLSEISYDGFEIPAGYSLALTLAEYFNLWHRHFFKRLNKQNVLAFTKIITDHNLSIGFTRQSHVKKYMDYVIEFGINYRSDPQFLHIWQAITEFDNNDEIIQALTKEGDIFRSTVIGDAGEKYYQALQNVMCTAYEHWYHPNTVTEVMALLTSLYPERAAYVGEKAICEVIKMAQLHIEEWGLPLRPGIALCSGLMFFLGIGCMSDPLYPWVDNALHTDASPAAKARSLFDIAQRMARSGLRYQYRFINK